ncbi:MAG TPA: DNA translocase FtsK 4TM domain-containing protein [Xanthobacteraceae bacterium]|nr:DNA translocase FtsK 4TM domain-containing protein [Xanthobacteraceae bacterium]
MPAVRQGFDPTALLPDELRGALRRRAQELGGLALIALAAGAGVALATWSVQDPSLSHATGARIRNLLGAPGAITADLLIQLMGVGAIALIVPVGVWGWRLLTHRHPGRERLRLACWLAGGLCFCAFASCLPTTAAWPLPTGLGGVIGDALLHLPAALVNAPLSGMVRLFVAAVTGIATVGTLGIAMGWGVRTDASASSEDDEGDDDPSTWVSLGLLYHGVLSLKARALRFLTRGIWARTAREPPRAAESEHEPPGDEEEEEEEEEEAEPRAPRGPRKRVKVTGAHRLRGGFELPAITLLSAPKASDRTTLSVDAIQENATALESVLADFGVRGEIINAHPGPVVTLYELEPAPGIKSSRVIGLSDDIARSMSALSTRAAVVPGRNVIGIELPNPKREKVYLRELLANQDYVQTNAKLPLCLGKSIGGDCVIVDLARMPHLLIAGTTGSGKSVAINTMILSLVYRLRPEECRLIMVDPKMLELSVYDGIPHLLTPVVTDPKKAVVALKWAVREMEERYKKMSKLGVRNIDGYNARAAEALASGETITRTVHTGYDRESGEAIYEKETIELELLPYIVVIVDEMADLMMVAGKDIEGAIQRIAQMARAAGIHVILATQRPSVDVITGTIKANFPTRISFQVTSKIDSRTILGEQGAEQLLGQGDMLYMAGGGRISRVHGPFVSDDEVEKVVRHLKSQGAPQYLESVTAGDVEDEDNPVFDATAMGGSEANDLYQQAVQIVMRDRKASTSYIQRRLQIGYNRAASLMERMEQEGVVGAANHAGKREILVGENADERY